MIDVIKHTSARERFGLLVMEASPSAMILIDDARRIALVNRTAEDLFGYSRGELIGEAIEVLVPERLRAHHSCLVSSFLADPQTRAMGAGRDLFGRRKNGAEVPIEVGLNPIEAAEGLFTLVSVIDLTARKRAEEIAQNLAALVESAEDAILSKGLDGIIRTWNPGAERLLGYRAEDIIGRPVTLLLPDDRQEEEVMILDRIRRGQPVDHFETVRRRRDGSQVDVSLTISPIRDRYGSIVGASKIMRDITQRKREEEILRRTNAELMRANAELDEFVYTASHDLRAPLTGISTVAAWIIQDDDSLSVTSRERIVLIQNRIERLKRLLDDIRDHASAGRDDDKPEIPLSAAELLTEVIEVSSIPAGFSVRSDPSLDDVQVNQVPLHQVLHNLINNAVKHHDRPTGSVQVSVASQGPLLRFSIIDDGPGIPAEYREAIFEMFKTLKPKDVVEGSGMGLALVRKIVLRMGGSCGVDDAPGGGSNFWFDWPRVR